MNRFPFAVFLAFLLSLVCAHAAAQEIFRTDMDGQLTIEPDGSVSAVQLVQTLGEATDATLRQRIQAWRFAPILEAGQPVRAKAHFSLKLQADFGAQGGGQLRITGAQFVDPPEVQANVRRAITVGPRYPKEALRQRLGAEFVLLVKFDETGKVVETSGQNGWLITAGSAPRAKTKAIAVDAFVAAADAAARQWNFADLAKEGKRVVKVPLMFTISQRSPWRRSLPMPVEKALWTAEIEASKLGEVRLDGTTVPNRFRLLDTLDAEDLAGGVAVTATPRS